MYASPERNAALLEPVMCLMNANIATPDSTIASAKTIFVAVTKSNPMRCSASLAYSAPGA